MTENQKLVLDIIGTMATVYGMYALFNVVIAMIALEVRAFLAFFVGIMVWRLLGKKVFRTLRI